MRPLVFLAFLLTPPGLPSGGFRWQRTVTPPAGATTAQACILLDAATFANAAPALRDLRLFQDGAELPYAIEESYDPRALESGVTTADDRSLYEPVLSATLQPRRNSGFSNGEPVPPLSLPGEPAAGAVPTLQATLDLPAHVPVERVRVEPAPDRPTLLHLQATEDRRGPSLFPGRLLPSESLTETIDTARPSAPVTLGVNLQHAATIKVRLDDRGTVSHTIVFEMRRRSLCYQPRSAAPLTLYLGGGTGVAAKTYSYASNFSTALDRPYATLGPLVPNPDDAESAAKPVNPQRKRLLWAAVLAAAFFVFSATRMLGKSSRSSQ